MRSKSVDIYQKLLTEDRILELEGQIRFFLGDVDIVVRQRDVVGNIIQEWLQGWLEKRNIDFRVNENSQMPPDFFLNPDDLTQNLLEVKAFNRLATPGFDIADFRMYQEEIVEKPYMLDVDYLIFGYNMANDGTVTISDLWLKKVWEITRRMENWAINLQIKANVVHKIRPAVWYSTSSSTFRPFNCLEDFVSAIEQTVWQNPKTRDESGTWKKRFLKNYEKYYKKEISIPRWDDIEQKYRRN